MWSKVRDRERVGENTAGGDGTISLGEEIAWVTLGELISLLRVYFGKAYFERTYFAFLRTKDQPGVIERFSTARSEVCAEDRKPLNNFSL